MKVKDQNLNHNVGPQSICSSTLPVLQHISLYIVVFLVLITIAFYKRDFYSDICHRVCFTSLQKQLVSIFFEDLVSVL